MQPNEYECYINQSRAKVAVFEEEIWHKIKRERNKFEYLQWIIVISNHLYTNLDALDYHYLLDHASNELEPTQRTSEEPIKWNSGDDFEKATKNLAPKKELIEVAIEQKCLR